MDCILSCVECLPADHPVLQDATEWTTEDTESDEAHNENNEQQDRSLHAQSVQAVAFIDTLEELLLVVQSNDVHDECTVALQRTAIDGKHQKLQKKIM